MNLFSPEQQLELKKHGYKIETDNSTTMIHRRRRVPLILLLLGSVLGIFFIFINFGENQIFLLGVLLVFAPLIYYRSNVAHKILIDTNEDTIEYSSGYFRKNRTRKITDIESIELKFYDYMGTVSPFKEGYRDYYADIMIKWKDGKETEIFHFSGRKTEDLQFANTYQEMLKKKLMNKHGS